MLKQDLLAKLESWITELDLPAEPKNLYEPIKYILGLGGKRVRPALVFAIGEILKLPQPDLKKAALAVEAFHNFTLVHDDIMDNSDKRRGQDTVHKKWDQNIAILSGDAMLIEVYKLLIDIESEHKIELIKRFNDIASLVCEGQQYDMDFEELEEVSPEEYLEMIRKKTAVLLAFAMQVPALLIGEKSLANTLFDIGINLGMAFQVKDDLLDVFPQDEKFGKQLAGDIYNAKKTILYLELLESAGAEEAKSLESLYAQETRSELEVQQVRQMMQSYAIEEKVKELANSYSTKAENAINKLEQDQLKEFLSNFTHSLLNRTY